MSGVYRTGLEIAEEVRELTRQGNMHQASKRLGVEHTYIKELIDGRRYYRHGVTRPAVLRALGYELTPYFHRPDQPVNACHAVQPAPEDEAAIYRGIRSLLIRAHCAGKLDEHECVGVIQITRKAISFACARCGDARQTIG